MRANDAASGGTVDLPSCILYDTEFSIVEPPSAIPVVFYRTAQGGEPVREWLRSLPIEDRQKIGRDLALVQ